MFRVILGVKPVVILIVTIRVKPVITRGVREEVIGEVTPVVIPDSFPQLSTQRKEMCRDIRLTHYPVMG